MWLLKKDGLFFLVFFLKVLLLLFQVNRILMALLAFEFLVLKIFFLFVYKNIPYEKSANLVFLAVAAGEASMGLSLLVTLVRSGGRENLRSLVLSKCEGLLGY